MITSEVRAKALFLINAALRALHQQDQRSGPAPHASIVLDPDIGYTEFNIIAPVFSRVAGDAGDVPVLIQTFGQLVDYLDGLAAESHEVSEADQRHL